MVAENKITYDIDISISDIHEIKSAAEIIREMTAAD